MTDKVVLMRNGEILACYGLKDSAAWRANRYPLGGVNSRLDKVEWVWAVK